MVKSSSCFKLITCGGDSGEKDHEYQPVSESKDSNDKRGWSFRKRSARHRVLSNTVITTETPSSANKESSEYTSINSQPVGAEPNVVEKIHMTNFSDGKPQLSSLESSQMPETVVSETESKVDDSPPESAVIIIQAAIRGFLARRALLKSKNVVKLQAAVRGHLVRRNAVGTLRCVQAIVKMQALVRARRLQQSRSGNLSSHKGNEHHASKSNVAYTSIEKILSNKFACQLLESTPKNKPIHVKCDPSKGDSAWRWLERWMSVPAADSAEHTKLITVSEQPEEAKESASVSQLETGIPSEVSLQSNDMKLIVRDLPLPSEDEAKETTYHANDFDFEASSSTSLVKDHLEEAPEKINTVHDADVTSTELDSSQNERMEPDASASHEPSPVNRKPEIDGEQYKQSKKRVAADQLEETEGKKSVHGLRKSSNPAFIAAQSKFEELTSGANSGKSSTLSNQDAPVESHADTSSVAADTAAYRPKELFSYENSATYPSIIVGSESGTELSISSTLDSPDRSESGAKEIEHDTKDFSEGMDNPESKIDVLEANILQADPAASLPNSASDQVEIGDDIGDNTILSGIVQNSEEAAVQSEKSASGLLRESDEAVLQDNKMSPEASPRSQQYPHGTPSSHISMTITESQGTPSSQVFTNESKESKSNKTGSGNRRRILSAGNKSPANANHDSGSSGRREQPAKDQSGGKRRSSFGTAKSDQIDQEARDSGSSNSSLPRFMQVTESARAKINVNSSPRSSPDVHDQDIHVKKRHSLPGATGRQDSPRVQRSPQLSTKGNGLHERKWQR